MAERVRTLIGERKQNKLKVSDLESQITDLQERLHKADKKSSVTATVGQRKINTLNEKIDKLQEEMQEYKNMERRLQRKIEDAHFISLHNPPQSLSPVQEKP